MTSKVDKISKVDAINEINIQKEKLNDDDDEISKNLDISNQNIPVAKNTTLQIDDNFFGNVTKILSMLEVPKLNKTLFDLLKCGFVIFISSIIFYCIDLIVSPIARILVGY